MQPLQRSEHYTDKGHYAVMTRTAVVRYAQLTRIADQLRSKAEELVFSTNPPIIDDWRIAGEMLGLAITLAPEHIGARVDL